MSAPIGTRPPVITRTALPGTTLGIGPLTAALSPTTVRLTGTTTREEREAGLSNCRMGPVLREYRRPIAYDVDYVYKGTKYRSRLAEDPGNRLRVRVAVTPWEDPAPLTAGQGVAPVADEGLVTAGQSHDKFMGIGRLGCRHNFFLGSIKPPITDVKSDGPAKQHGFLWYYTDLLPQGIKPDITDINAVNPNCPGRHIIKARNQIGNRRFSGPTRTDNRNHFAGMSLKRNLA